MRAPLTPAFMLEQLIRFNDTWPRWDADDEQFLRMARSFCDSLNDLDAEAVAGGVGIWLKTSTSNRWPSPAQVRECAMRWVQANRDTSITRKYKDDDACQVCGAVPGWAELEATDWRTGKKGIVTRRIHPCDEGKHGTRPFVPFPPNFIRWAPIDPDPPTHVSLKEAFRAIQGLDRKA